MQLWRSSLLPQECHILNPVAFHPAFLSVTSSLCFVFPAYLTDASHGDSVAESGFASRLFCCSACVKSEADVHLIKHNTLVLNSCLHQLRHIDRGLALQVDYFISEKTLAILAIKRFSTDAKSECVIRALSYLQRWSHSAFKSLFTCQAPAIRINSDLKLPGGKAAEMVRSTVHLLTKVVKLFIKRVTCRSVCH